MDGIVDFILRFATNQYEDDVVDRMNHQYTSFLFAIFAVVVGYKSYFGSAITCWTPAEFSGSWYQYTRDYCLIENTYYLPLDDPNMPAAEEREARKIPYYQWVQFFLVFQAFLFYLPYFFWNACNWWTGVHLKSCVQSSRHLNKIDDKKRKAEVDQIAEHIHRFAERQRAGRCRLVGVPESWARNWVAVNYMLMKVLNFLNCLFQLFIVVKFLGVSLPDLLSLRIGFSSNWIANGIFPRQTMCDFEVRNKGAVQKYSVQCVLAMNMLNEKLFLVLFYWLLVLAISTLVNLVLKAIRVFSRNSVRDFTQKMLRSSGEKAPHVDELEHIMSPDVTTVLQMIASNAGENVCCEIVGSLNKIHVRKID